ncbi:hypothetical protein WAF17_08005 [Bernardetia sp. ABR2-2B]|uniref:hypothetical protein n=1 Tax=Bernardetia sp. ABR2-2B TaxID=3127472 RepID=UPI0030D1F914
MKQKIRIIIVLFFYLFSCKKDFNYLNRLSYNIKNKKIEQKILKINYNYFHKVRLSLFKELESKAFLKSDTLFLLESFEDENGRFFTSIWSYSDTINYVYFKEKGEIADICRFSNETIHLTSSWDIENLKKKNSSYPYTLVYATRIIQSQNNIDVISFPVFD